MTFFVCFNILLRFLDNYLLYSNQKDLEDKRNMLNRELENNQSDLNQIKEAIKKDQESPENANEEGNDLKKDYPQHFPENRSMGENLQELNNYMQEKNK
jgi:chromosome segregation ATPase